MRTNEQHDMIRAAATDIQARLAISAPVEFQAAEGDGESAKRPTFSIVAYTGAVVQVGGFYTPVVIDMTGFKAASQEIPILRDHEMSQIVGQTTEIKFGSQVTLSGVVTGDNEHAREVTSQAKNGFKWRASVGANIQRREFLEAGKTATVNGREVAGPLVIARETELLEVSFVSIGADNQTSANVAASKSLGTGGSNPMTGFDDWLKAKGFDPATLSDSQKAPLRAAYDAEIEAAKPPVPAPTNTPPAQTYDQLVAERRADLARQQAIGEISARWMDDRPAQIDEIDRLTKLAMASKTTTAEQFELAMLREFRTQIPINGGTRDVESGKASAKVIEAAVAMSAGLRDAEKHYDERTLTMADERFRHGIQLKEFLMIAASHNGRGRVSSSDLNGLLRAAYGGGPEIRANAGFSTLDISGILSNVGNKMLRVAFEAVESGWRDIATVERLNDFKAHTTYSLTGDLQYEKVGAGGEIPHGTLGELPYTLQADTYGKMLAITRKDLQNDDLGALNRIPVKLGRGAALAINHVFWTAFLADRDTFWAAGNSNYFEGAATNLQSSSLATALGKFRKQTDPDGKPLGITPKILLVPPELEVIADELMTSTMVNTGGSSTTDKVPSRNVWTSKFKTVMSSYLSNTAYSGYSLTHWFLLADPMDLATIAIGFLNGREMPVIESADADFDTLGIRFRGYHDFGVAKQEYRASVRSKGAA